MMPLLPDCLRRRAHGAATLAWCLGLLLLPAALHAAAQLPGGYPAYTDTRVNDFAGLLNEGDESRLRTQLDGVKRDLGVELAVVTIGSYRDYQANSQSFEAFATGLFNAWGIGDRSRKDGVLLLVAVRDRKVRIELGRAYGHAHDGEMSRIISRDITPRFKQQDYRGGIMAGTKALEAWLGKLKAGKAAAAPRHQASTPIPQPARATPPLNAPPAQMPFTPSRHYIRQPSFFDGIGYVLPFMFLVLLVVAILSAISRSRRNRIRDPYDRAVHSPWVFTDTSSSMDTFDGTSGGSSGMDGGGGGSFGGGDSGGGGSSGSW